MVCEPILLVSNWSCRLSPPNPSAGVRVLQKVLSRSNISSAVIAAIEMLLRLITLAVETRSVAVAMLLSTFAKIGDVYEHVPRSHTCTHEAREAYACMYAKW